MTLASSISDATIWSVPYDRKTVIVQAMFASKALMCLALIVIMAWVLQIFIYLLIKINQLPDFVTRWQHGSPKCFARFI